MCLLGSIRRLALDAGRKPVALYGSRAVSLLLSHQVHRGADVDVAIVGGERAALQVKDLLAQSGYRVSPWLRRFQMSRRNTAWIFEATRNRWKFDVTAVQSFELLGQFSIEKLRIEMPSEKVIDRGASDAMRRRLLRLSVPIEEAIPHLLLARLLVLSACYELPLGMTSRNGRTAQTILELCQDAQTVLSEEGARASAVSALFRSIVRARGRRRRFLTKISRAGLTQVLGQQVAKVLAAKSFRDEPRLEHLSRREDVVGLMLRHCHSVDLAKLAREIGILRSREWNQADLKIVSQIEQRVSQALTGRNIAGTSRLEP